MIIISYDIADDKLRTGFAKYLSRFGHRIQYSVFEINNSNKILNNILCDIENRFSKKFTEKDSVYLFKLSSSCEVIRYGYAKHEEEDILIVQ
ncbi:MAG: CRISPR-associated endonuclease Cas2 [Bacteroidales bacterium]|nr:CRISPR-associated endonuclease Cas2 [Clostridium sp.]MCM1202788.1 CRISPR-associated endonuclease Cas2 [Bacteroidales bacterium]